MARHRQDPRIVAVIALVIAAAAVALEIAYTVGHFVMRTVDRVHG